MSYSYSIQELQKKYRSGWRQMFCSVTKHTTQHSVWMCFLAPFLMCRDTGSQIACFCDPRNLVNLPCVAWLAVYIFCKQGAGCFKSDLQQPLLIVYPVDGSCVLCVCCFMSLSFWVGYTTSLPTNHLWPTYTTPIIKLSMHTMSNVDGKGVQYLWLRTTYTVDSEPRTLDAHRRRAPMLVAGWLIN